MVSMDRGGSAFFSLCSVLFCALLSLSMTSAANGREGQAQNKPEAAAGGADTRPVLIELFTSEGCSSCPPADALLNKLDSVQPVAGAQLIVLSEHVDYWDHDGWKDPHSSAALTERQSAYVQALGLKTPYTPQMILDGKTNVPANGSPELVKILQEDASAPKIPVHIAGVTVDPGDPSVLRSRIEADVGSDKHNADVFVAVALDHVESQVLHGENGGRHLTHTAVVLQIAKVGKLAKGKAFDETVQLKLKPAPDPANMRVIAFVQESGPGRILGAALWKSASAEVAH